MELTFSSVSNNLRKTRPLIKGLKFYVFMPGRTENPSVDSSILSWPTIKLNALPKKEGFFRRSSYAISKSKMILRRQGGGA